MSDRSRDYTIGLLLALCVWGCGRSSSRTVPISKPQEQVISDVQPSVADGYVGDRKCSECHEEVAQSYQRHSMGNSLSPLTPDFDLPKADSASFVADGFRYSVRREGDRWIHRQARVAQGGSECAVIDMEVAYVVGSGNHGQSFLVDRDGYLFMSPITWYPDEDIWQLSPGYEKNNSQFNRPVVEVCLYCHSNRAPAMANTLNRYQQPVFGGHSIGCERCHGPGQDHVSQQEGHLAAGDLQNPIVNPGKLEPPLREAVCQQCHISGVARVLKPGKHLYDYRPGEPLESTFTLFTLAPGLGEDTSFVSHAEQMYESACFQSSDGKLGCISCHDPHRSPAPDQLIKYYRDRCLQCHAEQGCSLSLVDRQKVTAEDSCIVCHMPKQETEVRHAATTNHAVPRIPENSDESSAGRDGLPLVAFPSDEQARPTPRDLAIATVRAAGSYPDLFEPADLKLALTSLEAAIEDRQDDFEAMEALADLYLAENQVGKAMKVCRQVLNQAPNREQTLILVGDISSELGNHGQAIPFWKRAIDVNPWMSRYWFQLGLAYARTEQWFLCRQLMQTAKVRFPTSIGVRQLLVESNLQLGDASVADSEFREIKEFDPPGFGSVREWYRSHPRRK